MLKNNRASKPPNSLYVANPFRWDDDDIPEPQATPVPAKKKTKPIANHSAVIERKKNEEIKINQIEKPVKVDVSKEVKGEWLKLGGLGPNVGGEEWQVSKNKANKMHEFAQKVAEERKTKGLSHSVVRVTKSTVESEKNAREKALEYAKEIPRPKLKQNFKQQKHQPQLEPIISPASILAQFEMRHKFLQKLVKKI